MRKAPLVILVILTLLAAAVPAHAFPQPDDPIYVTDTVGLLSAVQKNEINSAAAALEDRTGAQVAVAIVSYYDGFDVAEYATDLYNHWGIGSARDEGALILLATEDREIFIAVGDGLSAYLSDSRAGSLIDDAFIPYAQRDDFAGGIVELFGAVEAALSSMPKTPASVANLARPTEHIADNAGVLSGDGLPALRQKLVDCERNLGVNIVVATVPTLGGETIEALANDLFNAWKIGGAYGRGILLLIAPSDGAVRIEVSDDMLEAFPDSKIGALIDESFLPYSDNPLGAVSRTVDALIISSEAAFPPVVTENTSYAEGNNMETFLFLILLVVVIVMLGMSRRRRRRVPPPRQGYFGAPFHNAPFHSTHHRYRRRAPHVIITPPPIHGHPRHTPPTPPGGFPGQGSMGGSPFGGAPKQQPRPQQTTPRPPSGRPGGGFSSGGGASRGFKGGGGGGRPSGGGRSFGGGHSSGGGSGRKF